MGRVREEKRNWREMMYYDNMVHGTPGKAEMGEGIFFPVRRVFLVE